MAVAVDFAAAERVRRVLHDSTYKDYVENAASFNTKLLTERKMRLPFLDSQTGLAQTSCRLWFHRRQRMPGLKEGQVYSYPQQRWRKRRRQYLQQRNAGENANAVEMGGWMNEDSNVSISKDSAASKDELSKESWYYDELLEGDGMEFEEPDYSDDDYEDLYIKRKKKKPRPSKGSRRKKPNEDMNAMKQTRRQQAIAQQQIEERIKRENNRRQPMRRNEMEEMAPMPPQPQPLPHPLPPPPPQQQQPLMPTPAPPPPPQPSPPPQPPTGMVFTTAAGPAKEPVQPSPYCDFCLGDDHENKKTGSAEELVSCADCGRSGHPTCLQFTDNMILSAKCYGWQCIECKCCWICGTSENDEQLLFCDDCDRGYHMYCLRPPLTTPPEGSWSCNLCIKRFHQ